ncbi:hypothetical protein [Pararhizobium sp. DWP3-4]|uniref:hypothetical protein n=1 Tax=Pararhizobium sp. DWP3-4 TaxID=2804565 RepID=UPI003CEEB305
MSDKLDRLLQEIFDAHGGINRWRQAKGLASTIVTGGKLWGLKGIEMDRTPRRATTDFHRQWTQIDGFGNPDWKMRWVPEHVEITDEAGTIIAERDNGREAFGDRGFETHWDPLNLAYFNGYAMWTYHALPFLLAEPGYVVHEIPSVHSDVQNLRGLAVRFPDNVHSHTRDQRFYFGTDGLLCRHDYEVDVWANSPAAHFLSDYVEVDGFKFPTRRSVFARRPDGSPDKDFSTVTVELSEYAVQ